MPPLLAPIWLPLIGAAIVSGVLLSWLMPVEPLGHPPAVRFSDMSAASGITFVHHGGANPDEAPTTLGGGVVVLDYDLDGDPDLFFVNGTDWPWEESMAKHAARHACTLYRNDGHGRFADVSALAEVNLEFPGMAAAAGDFDQDGLPDLYVTGIGANHLFRNRGGGRFEDVTEQAAVSGDSNAWSTGATWIDFDHDGRLDLVVCHYARWPEEVGLDGAFSVALLGRSYGTPTGFLGAPPTVYRNLGDGRFSIVPGAAGLIALDAETGLPVARALAIVPGDENNDGLPDLLCTFHTHPAVLFINLGDGSFRPWSGGALDRREGGSAAPLPFLNAGGVDASLRMLRSFTASAAAGHNGDPAAVDLDRRLGLALADFDHDGRLEAFASNSRLEPDINRFEGGRDFAGVPQLLWRESPQSWNPVWDEPPTWARPLDTRAVATADLDGDGDPDVVLTQFAGSPVILRNESRDDAPWLGIDLAVPPGAPTPVGARVEVHTPRRVHVRLYTPPMSLFAQSESTLYFGLGEDARVRRVVITWPDRTRTEFRPEGINRRITVRRESGP